MTVEKPYQVPTTLLIVKRWFVKRITRLGGLEVNIAIYICVQKRLGNCERCGKVVEGKILKASGGFYHPDCFTCVVRSSSSS